MAAAAGAALRRAAPAPATVLCRMTSSSSSSSALGRVLASSVSIASKAGEVVRQVLQGGDLGIVEKTGAADLQTQADRSAQDCILASLALQHPGLTVVGEEGGPSDTPVPPAWLVATPDLQAQQLEMPADLAAVALDSITVWVDPLDGTKEFTQGLLDHVTVLIGIAVGGRAVAGVVHQPFYNHQAGAGAVLGRTMYGVVGGGVAGITPPSAPPPGRVVTTTRSHGTGLVQQALDALQPSEVLKVGGAGHKVLLLLEGRAHAYVFPSPGCKKWDTCAPEALLTAMGGRLTDMQGKDYQYHSTVQHQNSQGVLATAPGQDHAWYLAAVPQQVKEQVAASLRKK